MTKEFSKRKINFLNFLVSFSILFGFGLIIKNMFYDYAIKTNINKASIVTQELLAARHYLASVAPYTVITNDTLNTFALSPAVVGSKMGEILQEQGYIYLKQTSLKYRNPKNAPDDFETTVLKKYENNTLHREYYEISKIKNKDYLRYTYPLYIEKACLACHGKPFQEVEKKVYDKLVAQYGEKSFNYKLGELRGIISVAIDMKNIEQTMNDFSIKIIIAIGMLFLVIILFFYFENKLIYMPQIKKIKKLNATLETRIQEEVQKNRLQDQQLIQQSRLAQMGEMISMIAHQWRQPLNAISITASDLKLKLMLGNIEKETFTQQVVKIDNYSQHLSKTIDDFRNFFKNNKTKTYCDLDTILSSTLEIVGPSLASNSITIKTRFQCSVKFDIYENEIRQVVLNLIKNAEDVLLENKIQNPLITIVSFCDKNNNPILYIQDNGGGISKDIMDKIFNPYFSTKTKKDGTGLGLYMSKIIVEEHCNGKLYAYNKGDGAVFEIKFYPTKENDD